MRPGTPRPAIVPLSNGALQIEWHCRGWDVEIEIDGTSGFQAWCCEIATGREQETGYTSDLGEILPFIVRISDLSPPSF